VQAATGLLDIEPAARATLPVALPGGLHKQQVLPRALPLTEPRKLLTGDAGVPRHPAPRAEKPPAPVALGLGHAFLAVVVGHHHLRAVRERAVGAARAEEQGLAELGAPALEDLGGSAPRQSSGSSAAAQDASGHRTTAPPPPPPHSSLARTWPDRHAGQNACAQAAPPRCAAVGAMGSMQMLQGWCCCAPSAPAILPWAAQGREGRGRREVPRAGASNRRESLRLTGFLLRGK